MIVSKKNFERIRKGMESFDAKREKVISLSREARIASKKAIYAIHKDQKARSEALLSTAKRLLSKIERLVRKEPHLSRVGAYGEALEEYVEASCYRAVLEKRTLPTPEELGIDAESYLPGVCDLVGEVVRRAINCAAKGNVKEAIWLKQVASELYEELSLFEPRNNLLRRKLDSIKYSVERLENLTLELKK